MVNGGFAYGYLHVAQNPNAENVFNKILSDLRPSKVLEIGTMHGGLTLMVRDILDNIGCSKSIIRTYDINKQEFLIPLVDNRVEVVTKNLFNENYSDFKDDLCKKEIEDFISSGEPTLVLCDGGCKKCEYNLIAPFLKDGDVIMAHDYSPNKDYFNEFVKNKIWDWLEIEDNDISDSVKKYSLIPFLQEAAQQAAWSCKIKSL
jgi:hypothetical protein